MITILYTTGFSLTSIYYITKFIFKYTIKRSLPYSWWAFRYWRYGTNIICDILLWYQLTLTLIKKPIGESKYRDKIQ